ncbi:hypothetical protein COR50_06560 [Chitinophaga caeni]|uniref:PDZ domain-containing protein n=1 Tax=Chitinophaga caeni TaxID=2029983 RepID=A0A291QS97_9BACT|nr:PDZ domain-containing protein [Chitinophaga caeni]ATL46868.1 hypothetical protein COR50_06560 [Chitinophaga caeni]
MKERLKKFSFLAVVASALIMPDWASAQNTKEENKSAWGEYDELVIKRKNDKDSKVTIEFKGDDVYVNGKKLDQNLQDSDLSVQLRKIVPMNGNDLQFLPGNSWESFPDPEPRQGTWMIKPGKALLGVMTEKKEAAGATVIKVEPGSPADKAGLKEGDIITKIDQIMIDEPKKLFETIAKYDPGKEITVTYLRDKKEHSTKAKLQARKEQDLGMGYRKPGGLIFEDLRANPSDRGMFKRFFNFNDRNSKRLGIEVQDREDGKGATIISVEQGSLASKAGLQENDIILNIAGTAVASAKDVADAYAAANKPGSTLNLVISRNGKQQKLSIPIPKQLNSEKL